MGLGLSGIVPTMHFTIEEGFVKATTVGQMGWFYLMGAMYITGAGLYAARIPERYFPGKCDIWVSLQFRNVTLLAYQIHVLPNFTFMRWHPRAYQDDLRWVLV